VEYKKKFNSTVVPHKYHQDPQLGKWVSMQRIAFSKDVMSLQRVEYLDTLGFVWDPLEVQWLEMFERLKQYKAEFGSVLVPKRYNPAPEFGIWVGFQREYFNRKRLSKERIALLDSIGFVWDPFEVQWMEMYQRLVEYKEIFNSTEVLNKHDPQLERWVVVQRSCLNRKEISERRIKYLDSIGFVWDPLEVRWMEMFERLKKYKAEFGSVLVPQPYHSDPELGNWVRVQRRLFKQQSLSEQRLEMLNSVSFVWARNAN
jgi:hypothetical protein